MQPQQQQSNGSTPPGGDMQQNNNNNNRHKSATTAATPIMKFSSLPSSIQDFPTSSSDHFHQMQRFDHAPQAHDDFLEQMLSSLNSASGWDLKTVGEGSSSPEESDNGVSAAFQFDEADVALKLRAQQQHMLPMPFGVEDLVDRSRGSFLEGSSFDSFHPPGEENQMADLFNRSFVGSLLGSGQQLNLPDHFQSSQQGGPSFDAQAAMNSQAPVSSLAGPEPGPPKQRVRARRGQATDPHSIAERLRRERIAERMKGLQELVPNANKTDKASMLDEIIEYVKFLQFQVKVLSMSRLGGAGAVPSRVADNMSKEGSLRARAMTRLSSNGEVIASSGEEGTSVNENQVAKLMEEDMGSAMQYLQSKGLCLMPISLATAISTAKNPLSSSSTKRCGTKNPLTTASNGNGPTSSKCER